MQNYSLRRRETPTIAFYSSEGNMISSELDVSDVVESKPSSPTDYPAMYGRDNESVLPLFFGGDDSSQPESSHGRERSHSILSNISSSIEQQQSSGEDLPGKKTADQIIAQRLKRRRERNRVAARKSRERRVNYVQELEQRVELLQEEIVHLKQMLLSANGVIAALQHSKQ